MSAIPSRRTRGITLYSLYTPPYSNPKPLHKSVTGYLSQYKIVPAPGRPTVRLRLTHDPPVNPTGENVSHTIDELARNNLVLSGPAHVKSLDSPVYTDATVDQLRTDYRTTEYYAFKLDFEIGGHGIHSFELERETINGSVNGSKKGPRFKTTVEAEETSTQQIETLFGIIKRTAFNYPPNLIEYWPVPPS